MVTRDATRKEENMVRRPPAKQTKTYRIDEVGWRLIEAAAAKAEMHPSTYLREAALRQARRELAGAES